LIDLFASEYGWTRQQIDALPIDEEAELLHAILYRKGAKTYRKEIQTEQYAVSLAELRQDREIDTSDLTEGISWHLP
jgi:hypothetical protein